MNSSPKRAEADELKRQVSIRRVIERWVPLKQTGEGQFMGCCPFHKDSSPSMSVTTEKGLFNCFGCGKAGDVFDFVAAIEGVPFSRAIEIVADQEGFLSTTDLPTPQPTKPKPAVAGKITAVYPYVDEQGELLFEVCRIEPGPDGKSKDFRQRCYGPNGEVIWKTADVRRVLFRLPDVIASDRVYLVEGEKDALTLISAGVMATTASGGAKATWVDEYTETLAGKEVIVIPDNDEPGRVRADKVCKILEPVVRELVRLELPKGKDVTEYFELGHSLDDLEEIVRSAQLEASRDAIEHRGLLSPAEVEFLADPGTLIDPSKRPKGLMTGFAKFDAMTLGLHAGELVILAARPSMGKTALALNVSYNVASKGRVVGLFSLEMDRESLMTRMICAAAQVDQLKFRGGYLNQEERTQVRRAWAAIRDMPLYIDDRALTTLKDMRRKLEDLRRRAGRLDLVVLDYLQLMEADGRKDNRNQEVSSLSRGLKLMAKEMKVPFLVLSQLSRAAETRVGDHRPQLSDLRESGSIEQDADLVGFIYREEVYRPDREDLRGLAELIIGKQRNGPIGKIDLVFLKSIGKFDNAAAQ